MRAAVRSPFPCHLRLVSFDPLRTLGLAGVRHLKPEQLFEARDLLRDADWVLFPQTWQVNALVHGFGCRLFPSPASYRIGLDKVEMTRTFQALVPEHTPQTLILQATPEAAEQAADRLGFPMVAKAPRGARGEQVALIENRRDLAAWRRHNEVLYLQEYFPVERDLRVVVVGERVVAAYWRVGGDRLRHNVARGGEIDWTDVPPAAMELVEGVAQSLGVDHAGFDVLMVDGRPYLLELNVLFGLRGLADRKIVLAPVIQRYLEQRLDEHDPLGPRRPEPARPGRRVA